MKEGYISYEHIILIITAVLTGGVARIMTLKQDYRQYPSYPNGLLTNLVTGFIAAALGAVAVPAIMTKNFSAITFLSLAIQQFREVRKVEKDSLKALENTEFSIRGDAYIDGISKTFEARNYISLIVSLFTGITMQVVNSKMAWINILSGICVSIITFGIIHRFSKGSSVGDIADVKIGKVEVKDSELYVDDIYVTNLLGTDNARELVQTEAMAAVIYPKENHHRVTLDNYGQRQAILFEACRTLGLKRYNFTRKDYKLGRVVIVLVPLIRDEDALIEAIRKAPLLENVKKSHSVMKNPLEKKQSN